MDNNETCDTYGDQMNNDKIERDNLIGDIHSGCQSSFSC